ncbi:hypothetical protein J7U46_22890 [Pelomonas sp. V22]|uniref:hypothetical protein n=1 Tax=Pelomonas sp. V22 TaxID=2822139 RepID=UPI0024A82476|nr:hypothetical protein [Pelomonas sp. V22]MDI4635919.1 hypothetical protein [Pelomonas sp. V22]
MQLNIATFTLQYNLQLGADLVEFEANNKVDAAFDSAKMTLLVAVPNWLGSFIRCKADLIALRAK